jgi:hypothetical protein
VDSRALYLAVVVASLVVAAWLALQIIGLVLKLLFLGAVLVLALAAYGAWRAEPR